MPEEDRLKPPLIEVWSADGSEVRHVEVPTLDELLGERTEGLSSEAKLFVKLQMIVRDPEIIGGFFTYDTLEDLMVLLTKHGTISMDHAVDFLGVASETGRAYVERVLMEAREHVVPGPDPSKPEKLQ
ncbi:MAG: hypothetical protein HYV40_03415 [Candidatus Levybacteria bacterium]|nr:hypothetical protein [Candidatus Levybacteria bacterium]MBI4097736.1 hypothetical protein [Candidatus Levybacteria bacterium]